MVLVNSYDKELKIKTLEEVKEYFEISEEIINGDDYLDESGRENDLEFNKRLLECEDIFDVCDLLNEFSDISGNGSRYSVED